MCSCTTAPDLSGLKQAASVLTRRRLRNFHVPLFRSALAEAMGVELTAAREVLAAGLDVLDAWLDEFYPGHRDEIARAVRPTLLSYGARVTDLALEEIDSEAQVPAALFAEQYVEGLTARWTDSSIAQVRQIIRDEEDPEVVMEERFDEWSERRHVWSGEREATQSGAAFAKFAFATAGVERLVWRTVTPCDLCAPLEGATILITGSFLNPGDTIDPGGGTSPITVTQSIGHPPLHGMGGKGGVCECTVAAA